MVVGPETLSPSSEMPGFVVDMARHESLSVMPGVEEQLVLEVPQPFCAVQISRPV